MNPAIKILLEVIHRKHPDKLVLDPKLFNELAFEVGHFRNLNFYWIDNTMILNAEDSTLWEYMAVPKPKDEDE